MQNIARNAIEVRIEEKLEKIEKKQIEIENILQKQHKTVTQKVNKLQEHNEISEMIYQVTEKRLNEIELVLNEINHKLYE